MEQRKVTRGRIIFHIDMNSFYASVEIADDPSLKGKPLAIAGNVEERRGIIVTSSYEARAKGVKTTMPVWQAKRLCPELIVRKPNFHKYREASRQIFALLYEYTPLVEPVSIDEGYLDVTDCCKKMSAPELAREIQSRLLQELDLPCSIGIAPNKFLAKMASDFKKPLGITILRKREIAKKLWPLPLIAMHGVGKKTEEKLQSLGLKTIGDLARADQLVLKQQLGLHGVKIHERANGHDERLVDPDSIYDFKSVGNSTTLREDTTDEQILKAVFTNLAHEVGRRLRQKQVCAQNIQITIRDYRRKTITRSRKLESPIRTNDEILQAALFLWKKYWNGDPVRLLGITALDLVDKEFAYKQLDLFSYEEDVKQDHLSKTIDSIRKKFGEESLLMGGQLGGDRSELIRDRKRRGTSLDKDFLR
ncbi:MAG TPA: DNA polymerase IV [Bacilli bacterium]|nr:DNA polymerase IV [Bacilli bacterium]